MVIVFGNNVYGQLGLKDSINRFKPEKLETNIEFKEMAAGPDTSAGISANGELYIWGNSKSFGLSLDENKRNIDYPKIINLGFRDKIKKIKLGENQSLMLTKSNKLYSWGNFDSKSKKIQSSINHARKIQFNMIGVQVLDIKMSINHCCLMTNEGIYFLGLKNGSGRIGIEVTKGNMFRKENELKSNSNSQMISN
jgi:alpha-tubulin suppressor-like RCC1 family protein